MRWTLVVAVAFDVPLGLVTVDSRRFKDVAIRSSERMGLEKSICLATVASRVPRIAVASPGQWRCIARSSNRACALTAPLASLRVFVRVSLTTGRVTGQTTVCNTKFSSVRARMTALLFVVAAVIRHWAKCSSGPTCWTTVRMLRWAEFAMTSLATESLGMRALIK